MSPQMILGYFLAPKEPLGANNADVCFVIYIFQNTIIWVVLSYFPRSSSLTCPLMLPTKLLVSDKDFYSQMRENNGKDGKNAEKNKGENAGEKVSTQ